MLKTEPLLRLDGHIFFYVFRVRKRNTLNNQIIYRPDFVPGLKQQKPQLIELQLFTSAREERLELPTLGFGDRCSTN